MFDNFDEQYLQARVAQGFEITVESLEYGTESIESYYDDALVAPFVIERVLDAERRGFAAVIVSCFMDPGVQAAREVTRIPVIGPGEASMLAALILGDSFSILDVGEERYKRYIAPRKVRELGLEARFRSAWGTGVAVTDIPSNDDAVATKLIQIAKQLRDEDEPDAIIMGCTGLAMIAERMNQALDIPVIDASIAALRWAEMLLSSGWLHSSKSYPKPPKKERRLPGDYRLFQK
jgi:allantoin racemase